MRVANAPCSWGILEFQRAGAVPSFGRVLDEMAATGYEGTELGDWGFLPTDPAALRAELAQRELDLIAAFVPVRLTDQGAHSAGIQTALRTAALLSAVAGDSPFVVLSDATAHDPTRTHHAGRIRREHSLDASGWATFAEGANRIAQDVRTQTGLRTVFHHHSATFVETPDEIDELLSRTDPTLLGLCLDTGHYMYGGGDPVQATKKWPGRIWHLHLKDCDPNVSRQAAEQSWDYQQAVGHGLFCELGRGAVDFRAILAQLRRDGYSGWIVVEQDVLPSMGAPVESAARNREYLRSLGI